MAISSEELQFEKEYLEEVKKAIKKIIEENSSNISYTKKNITELKRFMWEQLSDYTDEERAIAMHNVDATVDITNRQILSSAKYERAIKNPYFGKVRFCYDDTSETEDLYIGIASVKDGYKFYVYDWRAPISSLFYNYVLGTAKYNSPDGDVLGEILEKMQFKIENGELIRCFRSDINIDDDYLQQVLAESSSEKMKSIVSTIQREQNEIIRNDSDKYLIVQGIAGSGKTSVAMHRIAYLLYRDLNLSSNNILIFSPSNIFSDYISEVLPELGEENVLKSTFNEFSTAFLKNFKSIESYTEFLEKAYCSSKEDKEIVSYKMTDEYKSDIEDFYEEYEKSIIFKCGINYNNHFIPRIKLQELFSKRYSNFPIKERIELLAENICSQLGIPVKKNITAVRKKILEITNIEPNYIELYNKFLERKFSSKNKPIKLKGKIPYEDISGLLYLYFKLNGMPDYSHIRQIVIDEAQDYTPFQMSLLKMIFKNASFTILGDINQTINPYHHYNSLSALCEIFSNSKYLELTKTYRSSQQIVDYSNRIIGANNVCAIRDYESIPVDIKTVKEEDLVETILSDLSTMKELGLSRVAIITKNIEQAKKVYSLLNETDRQTIQLINSSESSVSKSTLVIPSYLSKGLEFDGVISYNDIQNAYTEDERNLYYVVCTRAQHKLSIYNEPQKVLVKTMPNRS